MTLVMTAAVIVMFRRGSYLGLAMGVVLLLIVMRKGWWLVVGTALFVLVLSVSDSRLAERVKSIADTTHTSSSVRIQLALTGLDFIVDQGLFFKGTGAKMSKESHIAFYQAQPPDYQKRFQLIKSFFGNFHNSFLQMAVEYGLFFLISFLAATVCLMLWIVRRMKELDRHQQAYPVAALVVTGGFFVSQIFHGDLYSYGGIPYILVFSAGCLVVNIGGAGGDPQSDTSGQAAEAL
jgi:O-antigen ligase